MSEYQRPILLGALLLVDLAALAGAIAIQPSGHIAIIIGLAALSVGALYEGTRSLHQIRIGRVAGSSRRVSPGSPLGRDTARRLAAVLACAVVTLVLVWSLGPDSWTTATISVAGGVAAALLGFYVKR